MYLLIKIRDFLFGYTFLKLIDGGQFYNTNILLRRNLTNSLWVGKISRSLPKVMPDYFGSGKDYVRTVDFRDVDDRAKLGFRLAKLAGLRVLNNKVVSDQSVFGFDFGSINYSRISSNLFLTEYRGVSLPKYLEVRGFTNILSSDIKNKDEILKSLVFNLWIGCYDSKDTDYLVDDEKRLVSIDYHLAGPGFVSNPKLAVGAWGDAFNIDDVEDTGWCVGGDMILEYIKQANISWEDSRETIDKILSLSKTQIKLAMRGLNFYNQGTDHNINDSYLSFLLERRMKLESAIRQWIEAEYPKANLPKNNGVV